MFVPLTHPAGEAQADFGEAQAVIGGVECKAHYLAMDLPHSDDCFVIAFPAETTEAFLEGHVKAFSYFGGVPTRILYDNTKIAVAKILGGTERQRTFALEEVTQAIEDALALGTISFDAVRHLMLCRIERRPPRLDMENYPHLPLAQVHTTQAADYMALLQGATA